MPDVLLVVHRYTYWSHDHELLAIEAKSGFTWFT